MLQLIFSYMYVFLPGLFLCDSFSKRNTCLERRLILSIKNGLRVFSVGKQEGFLDSVGDSTTEAWQDQ